MTIYLVEGNPAIEQIEAADWDAAEAAIGGVGTVIGELVHEAKGRALGVELTEVKFSDESAGLKSFSGYGAVFGNIDAGGDRIMPGAFSRTLAEFKAAGRMPTMYYEHGKRGGGPSMPVGVWQAMSEDSYGLHVEGKLADTSDGRDLYVLLKEGAIGGMSIGYRAREFGRPSGSGEQRQLQAVQLFEVSLVNDPMNALSRFLSVKSADEIITIRDLETSLRDAGWSKAEAVRVCARFQAKSNQGDPDPEVAAVAAMIRRNIETLKI